MKINSAHYLPGANKQLGDRYLLLECLGDGTHGWVWRAERLIDGVTVAVKIPKQSTKEVRLLSEGKDLIGTKPHKNIIQIYSMGPVPPEKEWFAIEMEYFPSESLAQKLEHRTRNFSGTYERLLNIFEQVLNAVAHLSTLESPISHGDIKPHNILVGLDDLVKLTDFGSSALPEEIYVRTRENGGTILYAAPEYSDCVSRKGSFVDLMRGDIYSLGVLLYQLLTARLPHDTQNQVRTHAQFPKPGEINSGICPLLEQVILNAIEKIPENRFASLKEFQNAFYKAKNYQLEYSPELPVLAVEKEPVNGDIEYESLLSNGDYKKAAQIAKISFLHDQQAKDFINLLNALARDGRYYDLQKEIDEYSYLLSNPDENGKAIRLIALKTMLKLHQLDDLLILLNKAIEIDGESDELNIIHASALGMQAQYNKAKAILEKINRTSPGNGGVLKKLVLVCEQQRDYEKASGYLRAALKVVKNDEKLVQKRQFYENLGVW